jgi:hypothetical protein
LCLNQLCYCCRKGKSTDEADGPSPSKKTKSSKEDAAIKEQSKLMYKYRDQLKKELRKSDLQDLLEFNDQDLPVGEERVCIQFSAQAYRHVCNLLWACVLVCTLEYVVSVSC